jgi:putative selenium metabolism hydrolase
MGDNAIYKMLPVVEAIDRMGPELPTHDFLGQGRVTVTRISSLSPSNNAVPDECRIFVDRRLTFGDTRESVLAEIQAAIPREKRDDFEIKELVYDEPSHTGAVFVYEQYFPSWAMDEDHPFVVAGRKAVEALWQPVDPFGQGKWDFSTNGNYWRGKEGIPAIGFGPGNEIYAHAVNEHVPLKDVVEATKFYALLPAILKSEIS